MLHTQDTKSWGSGTAQPVSAARLTGPRRGTTGVLTPPQMSLMRLAEEDLPISPEQTNLPISPDQQESIISTLSLASSVLLLFIICGAGEQRRNSSHHIRHLPLARCVHSSPYVCTTWTGFVIADVVHLCSGWLWRFSCSSCQQLDRVK